MDHRCHPCCVLINRDGRVGVILGLVGFVGAMLILGSAAVPLLAVGTMGVAVGALVLLDTLNMTTVQRLMPDVGTGRAIGLLHTSAAVWMMAGVLVPTLCMKTIGVQAAILVPAFVVLGLGAVSIGVRAETRVDAVDRVALRHAVA